MPGKSDRFNRYYVCKICGKKAGEWLSEWKKKPQKDKNVCPDCLKKRRIARQTAKERAKYKGYGWF